jgi:hypothetical protein
MGRSHWSADAYFNGDMAGVFVVDEYLSADATSAIVDAMARGEDLTTQGPCAPQVLSPLLPVALSSADLCPILIVAQTHTHTHTSTAVPRPLYSSTGSVCISMESCDSRM